MVQRISYNKYKKSVDLFCTTEVNLNVTDLPKQKAITIYISYTTTLISVVYDTFLTKFWNHELIQSSTAKKRKWQHSM